MGHLIRCPHLPGTLQGAGAPLPWSAIAVSVSHRSTLAVSPCPALNSASGTPEYQQSNCCQGTYYVSEQKLCIPAWTRGTNQPQ